MANLNIIANINPSVMKTLAGGIIPEEALDYIDRVLADSGVIDDNDTLYDIVRFYRDNNLLTDTKLLAAPFLGSKLRTSGIYKYLSKLYSVELPANDLAQTTELSQPYQSGNIAPNEVLSMQNPNGDARYLTHPSISFAANQAWSVTMSYNDNWSDAVFSGVLFSNGSSNIVTNFYTKPNSSSFLIQDENNVQVIWTNQNDRKAGKNHIITISYNGNGSIILYFNGVSLGTKSYSPTILIRRILQGSGRYLNGTAHFYRIQSGAMTATQVLAEYNKLRTYIPEIETVQIGSKYITSSNFQAVATPAGNVIQEMQAGSAVEKITNAADREFSSDTGFWILGTGVTISGGTCNSAVGSAYPSLYKDFGSGISGKWIKITYDVVVKTSGLLYIYAGGGTANLIPSALGTNTFYIKAGTSANSVVFSFNAGAFVGSIDNLSYLVLGWSDAEELYNGLIAQGYTAANALKEVAMWCSYDNSTANQAIYGKLFNQYAIQLLNTDMAAQNFGYHIVTEAEKAEILAAYTDANDLKKEGTNYWDNALGTNASGLTLLGTGCRMPDGSFASIKKVGGFATSDGNVSKQLGLPIRLIRD